MIVITGASSGLGAELAKRYDAEDKETYIIGRNTEKLSALAKQLSHNVGYQACNLSLHQDVKHLFDGMKQPPEMVIHSAGSGYFGELEEQEPEEIQKLIDNNLNSAIHVLRELVKRYKDQPIKVVMVMSTAAQQPKAQESTYCAVKWAVKGLIESVRLELKGKPMKIIAVYPGGMDTEFWKTSGNTMDTSHFMQAEDAAEMLHTALSSIGNGYVSDITVNRI
ncbi:MULTISPECIES: SDR family NAD(P)-dependent oxidoreductase [Vibrio diabolicus subgroup]|jgi:short-subunit dehydrogenase|uniref:SDR family NAD(P)-dependent oxidoreductase n=1 Tax=Vibrio diabolicus subgroup TaxID=2315253 RepID=UPI00080F4462|nr:MULTISPECIES: SDR family NAD(P)-dependent oxidoreductase [Vibrio diabolicus subgroup]MCR9495368.1 SDR family NAD(P)-dependent oxidoreductase [Vibrio alginolyticus]MEA3484110.1 SDR family NAD(P)-dependent oxidoreductase [Pseudomonadota bacterium]KAB0318048.1 SDR family NAD(P)-dependent oxidoreductase [Vibrio diabolicus]MCG6239406.1 SDR family NAD(P)-dependent oxidoreductase [Vibrio diabolicus]MCQ9066721.1 SDR family NAD(P)-dependent oxidoreductase [Vibrio diabolicus]